MTEKSPAFQFYPKDVLSDGNAMAMPAEAFGIYMKLICFDWIDNGLIDDGKTLMRLGGYSPYNFQGEQREPEDWQLILGYLLPQFTPHPTKPGYITNPRLLKEREKQAERSHKAQESANKRWGDDANASKTHKKKNANALRTVCSSSSSSSSSSSPTSSSNKIPPTPKGEVLDLPDWVKESPEVLAAVQEWIAHRKEKRSKLSQRTLDKQFKKFNTPAMLVPAIEQSIINGWIGLFEVNAKKPSQFPEKVFVQPPAFKPTPERRERTPEERERDRQLLRDKGFLRD